MVLWVGSGCVKLADALETCEVILELEVGVKPLPDEVGKEV